MNEKELRAIDRAIKVAVQNYKKDLAKRTADAAAKKSASSSPKKDSYSARNVASEKMAKAAGANNKMKAQGAKAMGAPTSGYGKSTKPKK
jgi:hypothetical protein